MRCSDDRFRICQVISGYISLSRAFSPPVDLKFKRMRGAVDKSTISICQSVFFNTALFAINKSSKNDFRAINVLFQSNVLGFHEFTRISSTSNSIYKS